MTDFQYEVPQESYPANSYPYSGEYGPPSAYPQRQYAYAQTPSQYNTTPYGSQTTIVREGNTWGTLLTILMIILTVFFIMWVIYGVSAKKKKKKGFKFDPTPPPMI